MKSVLMILSCSLAVSGLSAEVKTAHSVTMQMLARRHQHQLAQGKGETVFYGFQFSNRVAQSGITFQHGIVDDAGKDYKAIHYDHGNSISAADVDNDGLADLYFTTQLGENQLWRNLGEGRFENWTTRSGLGLKDKISVGASFADVDNDGDADLFVTTVRNGNYLFENLGSGKFRDITKGSGLEYQGHSSAGLFVDYNRDGLLDLVVANVGVFTTESKGRGGYYVGVTNAFAGHLFPERFESSRIYRNLGKNKFRDVSKSLNFIPRTWSGDILTAHLNEDGFPDLYCLNMQGDDLFYINRGGTNFVEKTSAYFPKTPWGSTGGGLFDFNNDGKVELFVTDMHSDMTPAQGDQARTFNPELEKSKSERFCLSTWTEDFLQGSSNNLFGNAFYLNQGNGNFQEASAMVGAETFWPWGISVGDLNADGFSDVFVTAGMGYPFRYAVNSVLLNSAGKRFQDAEFLLGIEPRGDGRTEKPWFTLDCSGADKTRSDCKDKTGIITIPGTLSSRSSVILDLDNDGDLDIVTGEFNDRPQVLLSNLSEKQKLRNVRIKLVGKKSNRNGFGAKVVLRAGGETTTLWHTGKSGYLAQSSLPLYFYPKSSSGMIEVFWPAGGKTTTPISESQRFDLIIEEPME